MQSSKEKEQTLNKFKNFFRMTNKQGGTRDRHEFCLTPELEKELRPETPVAQRCKTLKELGDVVASNTLKENLVPKLWDLTKDLIVPNKPAEQRQIALTFYCKLIQGQFKDLGMMRGHFFHVIQEHDVHEDLPLRLDLLKALTYNGKEIGHFEEKIGRFMLEWFHPIVDAKLTRGFLEMLINIIRYNTAYLDKEIIIGILNNACTLSCTVDDNATVLHCLSVLDTVIRYAIFPDEALPLVIMALCRTVNCETYCQTAWQIMRNLLGTDLGHAALLQMCNILNERSLHPDAPLLRGAVFHINMGVWGSSSSAASTLRCTPSMVLLSFLYSLKSGHMIVTYEVTLSIQRLIQNQGRELSEPTWDVIIDILLAIAKNNADLNLSKDNVIHRHFHDTLDMIEELIDQIAADPEKVYALIEHVCQDRAEPSIVRLIEYRAARIRASKPDWLSELKAFIERFYKKMPNSKIRVHAIRALTHVMEVNRAAYEEEILDHLIMEQFGNIVTESDLTVRMAVAELLIELSKHCETKRCLELFEIMGKMINRQYDAGYRPDDYVFTSRDDTKDIQVLVEGLIKVFHIKLYRLPSQHASAIYTHLIAFLEQHYMRPKRYENTATIRCLIFNWMLKARANASYHIGYPDANLNGQIRYSHYLGIEHPSAGTLSTQSSVSQNEATTTNTSTSSTTLIPIRKGCKLIVKCLELEKDWNILQLVLSELPNILQNRALIQGNDVDFLTRTLQKMYVDKRFIETVENFLPSKPPLLSDLQILLLPAIASAATYHEYLDNQTQKKIVEVLKLGLFTKAVRTCVHALTVLLLEIPNMIVAMLADVLYEMSKLSSTTQSAAPILEFLSTMNRLPSQRFANFVQRDCMYVFAIALPYTNPYRFDHYVVSLAHHVVAGWFLKCRLERRADLVKYIIVGLQSNVRLPIQEKTTRYNVELENEDSSNRKRSSSLTERGSKMNNDAQGQPLIAFHLELVETCIDFLVRHTYSVCSALPKRMPAADFLLNGGQHMTWLVGNSLITITTSGCSITPLKNGLCDKCHSILPNHTSLSKSESTASSNLPTSPESNASLREPEYINTGRRYTKASFTLSSTNESDVSTDVTSSSSSALANNNGHDTKFFRQSSQEGRFSSSSSLEALSRRGSNPDQSSEGYESQRNSKEVHPQLQAPIPTAERPRQVCACCCTGWAEVCIRRPTGTMSWIMRIQNQITYDSFTNEFPLQDLTTLFTPGYGGVINPNLLKTEVNQSNAEISKILSKVNEVPSTMTSASSKPKVSISDEVHEIRKIERMEEIELDDDQIFDNNVASGGKSGPIDIPGNTQKRKSAEEPYEGEFEPIDPNNPEVAFDDYDSKSRNPVRRVNSSPEMSSNYRNPFLQHKASKEAAGANAQGAPNTSTTVSDDSDIDGLQKKKNYSKDMRVSCEAIPEEMGGSTPPSQSGSINKEETLVSNMSALVVCEKQDASTTTKGDSQHPVLLQKQHSAEAQKSESIEVFPNKQQSMSQASLNLKIPMEMQKVTTKPPQSPAPLSPRLIAKNAANKFASNSGTASPSFPALAGHGQSDDQPRGRSKTISVTSRELYSRDARWNNSRNPILSRTRDQQGVSTPKSGISPSFVFLQLYHSGVLNTQEKPILLDPTADMSLNLLDYIPPFETHNIGVLYVGPGQCNNEIEIFKNRYGSFRYTQFLCNLGTLVSIREAKENNLFMNLDPDTDGSFTYIWQDDIVHVTFHVATLMPNKEHDPNHIVDKKKHIGNDFVIIVYNESGEEFNLKTIQTQFGYACVIVEPLELNTNRVYIRIKDDLKEFVTPSETKIVSDAAVSLLARQIALHANLASRVAQSLKSKNASPYASNWLDRLRRIKRERTKITSKNKKSEQQSQSEIASNDFIVYTKYQDDANK
ncbi:tuberin [Culicoides brevitarsis]|uniref:tuberin n=1 Tax=Culicoides brevitarsis TaxID=469753 RepID=UPI00307BB4A0